MEDSCSVSATHQSSGGVLICFPYVSMHTHAHPSRRLDPATLYGEKLATLIGRKPDIEIFLDALG